MTQENTALDIQGLQVCFPGGLAAVDGVDLNIQKGAFRARTCVPCRSGSCGSCGGSASL